MPSRRPLFSVGVAKPTQNQKIDKEPIIYIDKDKKSNINEIISEYHPDAGTDRFVLLKDGERYACKFYYKSEDEFVGAGCLAMYMLNNFYDRSILPDYEDGNYFMKGSNRNE